MRVHVFSMAVLSAALVAAVLAATPAVAAARSCGYVGRADYHVKIERGEVSCKEARKAIRTVAEGGGKKHNGDGKKHNGDGPVLDWYWTLPGGWRCVTGAGGGYGCQRGGTKENPRDEISAEQRVEEEIRRPPSRPRAGSACSDQVVEDAGGETRTVGVVRIGGVSCARARGLTRAYYRRMATGHCEGNICSIGLPGGWSCSLFFATESAEAGGASAGCFQARTGAKVRIYQRSVRRSAASSRR